jgi:hypothetical protein
MVSLYSTKRITDSLDQLRKYPVKFKAAWALPLLQRTDARLRLLMVAKLAARGRGRVQKSLCDSLPPDVQSLARSRCRSVDMPRQCSDKHSLHPFMFLLIHLSSSNLSVSCDMQ